MINLRVVIPRRRGAATARRSGMKQARCFCTFCAATPKHHPTHHYPMHHYQDRRAPLPFTTHYPMHRYQDRRAPLPFTTPGGAAAGSAPRPVAGSVIGPAL